MKARLLKPFLLLTLLLCVCAVGGASERVMVIRSSGASSSSVFNLLTNQSIKLVDFDLDEFDTIRVTRAEGSLVLTESLLINKSTRNSPLTVIGPATVQIQSSSTGFFAYLTFEISKINDASIVSSTAVVIPEDANGPVQIILESSTDLITWTAANPGTYGASTTKRFFRVRAVKQ